MSIPTAPPAVKTSDQTRARIIIRCLLVLLVIFEAGYIWQIGNRPGKFTDWLSEAHSLRATGAYLKEGITSHHGLPRILYSGDHPSYAPLQVTLDADGRVPEEYRRGFPPELTTADAWPYTHYPPGPNLILAILARVLGFGSVEILRIFPAVTGILALAWLFKVTGEVFGPRSSVTLALALVLAPTIPLALPALHYLSYSASLLFVQMVILMRWFWQNKAGVGSATALFLVGFLQGWISWDFCFIVTVLVLPFWLLKRAQGDDPPFAWLILGAVFPAFGFVVAHVLNVWQVAAELGSLSAAVAEFRNTAAERGGVSEGGYFTHLSEAIYMTLRYGLHPKYLSFAPSLVLIFVAVAPTAFFAAFKWTVVRFNKTSQTHGAIEWPGPRRILPVLSAALLVSTIWIVFMPQHTAGNAHLTVRHLLVFYVFCAIILGSSLHFGRGEQSSK